MDGEPRRASAATTENSVITPRWVSKPTLFMQCKFNYSYHQWFMYSAPRDK